jgi:hypothetical protein
MPSLADLPVPAAPGVPVPAEAPVAPAAASPEALPTPFDAIVAGKLPGLQVPPIQKETGLDPIQDFVVSNLHNLQAAGLEYTDLPNDTTVVYNPELVSTEDIAAAFEAGTLDQLVPSSAQFQEFAAKQEAAAAPQGLAGVPPPSAGPSAGPAGSTPPGVMSARLKTLEPPSPIKPNPIPDRLARRTV